MDRRTALAASCLAALSPTAEAAVDSALEIGVLPNVSARVLLAQYAPMREFLSRELRRPVQVSTAPNWTRFHQRTLSLDYDLVVIAANLARLAQIERGHVPLLSYLPAMRGLLVSSVRRPVQQVAELAGQTLALANPQSLVALRGMRWLEENGLQRDRDFRTIVTPTDDSVGSLLVRGEAMAALLSGSELRAIPEALRTNLHVVTTFAEVPGFVMLASPAMPDADCRMIKSRVLAFAGGSEEGRSFFSHTGFTAFRDITPGSMESMDPYVDATRRLLAASGS